MHIIIIFILAFLIRLINLDQSLWLDETIVAKVVKTIPFHLIPFQFSPGDFHPPFYYLLISLWSTVFGTSEIALRLPSVLFALGAGLFVYRIGSFLKGRRFGLWAAVLFMFNPLVIYYSQEARMYMLATMFLTAALLHFMRVMKTHEKRDIVLFNAFSALSMMTFYGSAFFIAGMIAVGTFRKRNPVVSFLHLSIGLLGSLILLSPLLYQQLMTARIGLADVKNWSMVLGKAEFKNVAMILLKFASGRISWFPKWSYYLVAGGWSLVIGFLMVLGMRRNRTLACLFALPLLFGLFVSFWAPMMMYFRFLYLIPVMSLLLALTIGNKKNTVGYLMLFFYSAFSLAYLALPQFHREDWKEIGREHV